MKIYFTKNEHWYSKLLMWFEGSTMSHVGLGFFDDLGLVVDCTKPFSKVYHVDHWFSKYQIVQEIDVPLSPEVERLAYKRVVDTCLLKPYDWGAYAFAWVSIVRKVLFGTPYPDTNPWSSDDGFWCTEIFVPVVDILKDLDADLSGIDLASYSPQMVFDKLVTQGW